jgi:Protein of unknown function (DUF1592)/Protein of unknown function (DUF1588)/Protein of unknown function (DUF1587)/Protein of unknown function (DUF1585)/Protein of unknown function (DUF1595)
MLRRSHWIPIAAAAGMAAAFLGHISAQSDPNAASVRVADRSADARSAGKPASARKPGNAGEFETRVRPFLKAHCFECHTGAKPKGEFHADRLTAKFTDRARWAKVLQRVRAGEMPPKSKPRPAGKDLLTFARWIERQLKSTAPGNPAKSRTVLRRLNRVEYQNTIRDLLGVTADLKEMLPLDTTGRGFDTIGESLHVSSFLMERYLAAADRALDAAIADAPQPKTVKKRIYLENQHHPKTTKERVFLKRDDAFVLFSSSAWNAITMSQFFPRIRGRYHVRFPAYAHQSKDPVSFRVEAGPMLMGRKNHLVGYFDVPPGKPTVVEFTEHFEAHESVRILPYGLATAHVVNPIGAANYKGPGLAVRWMEVEGPLHDVWPPESHRRIFGDLRQMPSRTKRNRLEVISTEPRRDAERILRKFTRRAFRRPVSDADLKPYLELVKERLANRDTFESAVRVALKAVLASPDFLFLREKYDGRATGTLDDFALASRLSYFLWSSMPDETLLKLAEQRTLSRPETLHAQVERMLKDPKAAAFTENFTDQWLGLRDINFTTPDHRLYPEFDDLLKYSMVRETRLFFDELLQNDLGVANFVDSKFTMLNQRLARHYGIDGVKGQTFRKVTLPADSHRGGVLTMAGVLKVTANGTYTSPVVRGAWVLDRILGTPPPPPPSGVPAVEPDIRGATTIREQLAKHRSVATCAACHSSIDPPGFALESFDVIGGWRDNYRSLGRGKPVRVNGRRMPYHVGLKVDPSDVLADGRKFRNIDDFKKLLLADKDQLARSLAEKLLTYGTGRTMGAADRPDVDRIVATIRAKDYGLRSLVHAIVRSETFRTR